MALLPLAFTLKIVRPFIFKPCRIANCYDDVIAKDLCRKHYQQTKRSGILVRSIYDLNEIEIVGDVAYISLYNKHCELIAKAIIDAEDVSKVRDIKWSRSNLMGYVFNGKVGRLHRFIMNTKLLVDHRNNNVLDNRKENLRICSQQQNNFNKVKPSNNKSGAKGVCWVPRYQKYTAYINKGGKRRQLGKFTDLIEAAKAYNEAAIELFGEFAWLNDIKTLQQATQPTTEGVM